MNKYTLKIREFIDNNAKKYVSKTQYNSKFIDYLTSTYNNIPKTDILLKQSVHIKALHNNHKYPLLYTILKESLKEKYENYDSFLTWYREHSTSINLKNIVDKDNKYYDLLFSPIESRKELHKLLYENFFIPLDIIYCGEAYDLIFNEYTNKNTQIFVYSVASQDKPDINIIMKIIEFFRIVFKKNMVVNLTVFYCDQKKYLPDPEKMITPENINSGCTISGEFVYVWRKEEFYKVLIHELTHYFHVDFHDRENTHLENVCDNLIKIKGHDVVNEAYTEIMALTINSVIVSIIHNIQFSTIINYEKIFNHFQVAKIIYHFKGNTYDDLFNITIHQNTSLVSYIIVKGILLNNYDKVLEYFENNVNTNIKKEVQYNNYKKLYTNVMNRNSLNKNVINLFLHSFKHTSKQFVMQTLRMTSHDI